MSGLSPIDKYFSMTPPISHIYIDSQDQGTPETKRDSGRWSIYECQIYLDVLKKITNTKDVVQRLKEALPNRAESQIRAHHQKMMKKYGTIKRTIEVCGKCENGKLLYLSLKLKEVVSLVNKHQVPDIVNRNQQEPPGTPRATRTTPRQQTAVRRYPVPSLLMPPNETPVKLQPKE